MHIRHTCIAMISFGAFPAYAAAPELSLLTTIGSLLLVLALILAMAWLLKKMRLPVIGNQSGLSLIRQISVGTRERIVIVKVGDEQFLIGITPQSINLISRLDQPLNDEVQQESGQFARQLSQLLKKNEK